MILAVMSDLHDNVASWEAMNRWLTAEGITTLINCGDTCAPAMLKHMSITYPGDIHTVFGNVADRELETQVAKKLKNVHHYGDQATFNVANKRIGITHTPDDAHAMVGSGKYDLVCHGHTHLKRWERMNRSYVLNPGTAGGMFQYPSFAVVELTTMSCAFHEITL